VPGFAFAWTAVWAVSLLDRPPEGEAQRAFAAARARLG
jgi:hypothetical protein